MYFSFKNRLLLSAVMFSIFLTLGFVCVFRSLDFVEPKSINYTEKSNLDYKVYLKENDFYDDKYLGKDMVYVASLIDDVVIDFNYMFFSDEDVSLNFNYKIVGKLSITDSEGKRSFFEKQYTLLDEKTVSLNEVNSQNIKENIKIDYTYYNTLANKFKTEYGIDALSNFVIYFVVNMENNKENLINNSSMMSISIPLSEKSINIAMNYDDINNSSKLISDNNVIIDNIIYFVFAILFVVLSLVMVIRITRLLMLLKNNKSDYDKYIKKLLTEYDRLIVETSTAPIINENNVIKINKFQELLDVRDNLKLPIMYYVVTKHQKCYFYITWEDKIYLNTIKAIDLEKNK